MTHTVWCRGWHCVGDLKLHPRTYHASDLAKGASSSSSSSSSENDEKVATKSSRKTSPPPPRPSALEAASFLRSLRRAPPVSLDAEPGPACADDAAAAAAGALLSTVGALAARARGGEVVADRRRHSLNRRNPSDPAALVGGRCSLFARKFKADVRLPVRRGVVALVAEDEREAFPS